MAESPLIDVAAHKVMAQASCSYNEARELMRVSRAESGKTLLEIAEAVIDRTVRFDGHSGGGTRNEPPPKRGSMAGH